MPEPPATPDQAVTQSQWIAIATLLRPQGRRGELLSEPLTDLPKIFQPGREVYLASNTLITLEDAWHPTGKNAGRIVLKLSNSNSITEAESLAGQQLLIPADALPALDPDTWFVGDLIGCTLVNADQPAGTIVEIQFATAPDGRTRLEDAAPLLGVETAPGEDPVLVPFVRAWIVSVDIATKRVVMDLPAGLLSDLDPPIGDEVEDAEQH